LASVSPTIFTAKVSRLGLGFLGMCLMFKLRQGDDEVFKMLVLSLRREWDFEELIFRER
jgi:hypothetical protein